MSEDNEVRLIAVGAAVSVAVNVAVTAVSWSVGKRYGHPWIGGLLGFFILSPPVAGAAYSIVTGKLRPSIAPTPQRDILRDAAARDGLPVVEEGVRVSTETPAEREARLIGQRYVRYVETSGEYNARTRQ